LPVLLEALGIRLDVVCMGFRIAGGRDPAGTRRRHDRGQHGDQLMSSHSHLIAYGIRISLSDLATALSCPTPRVPCTCPAKQTVSPRAFHLRAASNNDDQWAKYHPLTSKMPRPA